MSEFTKAGKHPTVSDADADADASGTEARRRSLESRPAEYFQRFHDRQRSHPPGWIYQVARSITTPIVLLLYRARAIGVRNVPGFGPVILASNHFSVLDPFVLGAFLQRRVRFMAKSELYKGPMEWILDHGGTFPVRRGLRDEEAIVTAHSILRQGDALCIYAEGSRSRTGGLAKPHRGLGRIAIESGATVVPVAIFGSQDIERYNGLRFPPVTVQFGRPLVFERMEKAEPQAAGVASQIIFDRVRAMYESLATEGRKQVVKWLKAEGIR